MMPYFQKNGDDKLQATAPYLSPEEYYKNINNLQPDVSDAGQAVGTVGGYVNSQPGWGGSILWY